MKNTLSLLCLMLSSLLALAQTNYYVDQQNGNNGNNGMAPATAFQSMTAASSVVLPGDIISIIGQYANNSYNPSYTYTTEEDAHLWHAENSIKLNNLHGTATDYITIKAYDASTIIKGDGANIVRVQNSSYLRIEDLVIEGEVNNIPLATANALQFVYIDGNTTANTNAPTIADIKFRDQECVSNCTANAVVVGEVYSNMSGQDVIRASYIDTRGMYLSNVHHIDIVNNYIHHTPGGGLRVSDAEDINIIGNEIHDCSRRSYSGTHALVVTKATSTRTSNDYRIRIEKNKIHHNYNEQYSWAQTKTIITPHIDEGKGISLQRNETTSNVNWDNGRILVANNLCYFNGFSGIHSNDGNRIDIINNTCYFNSYTKSITEGITSTNGGNIGISAQGGTDVRIINNISIIDAGLSKSAIASNISAADGLVVENNVIYGSSLAGVPATINENANVVSVQVNTQKTDPLFIDALSFDFRLQPYSPAIGMADSSESPTEDFTNILRDAMPDVGALEWWGKTVQVKVFLQGGYNGTQMENDLQNANLIPLQNPYGPSESLASLPADIVDWVLVEVRDPNNSSIVLAERAALLRKDGQVLDLNGSLDLGFTAVSAATGFISVQHRNHLGVMTSNPVTF